MLGRNRGPWIPTGLGVYGQLCPCRWTGFGSREGLNLEKQRCSNFLSSSLRSLLCLRSQPVHLLLLSPRAIAASPFQMRLSRKRSLQPSLTLVLRPRTRPPPSLPPLMRLLISRHRRGLPRKTTILFLSRSRSRRPKLQPDPQTPITPRNPPREHPNPRPQPTTLFRNRCRATPPRRQGMILHPLRSQTSLQATVPVDPVRQTAWTMWPIRFAPKRMPRWVAFT